ncbi:MAG: LacI family transcriptional regulator [Firmicutes bacterium]|nr:LacI family transcriptional regulator [Bacillota bacterium]
MVTIKDVAKASGYSISTVSYALNDSGNIPQATKDKIWAVAKKLKYYPNAAARNLKNQNTMNIGFFVSGFSGPVYHKIYDGIATGLECSDYNLIVSFSKNAKKMITERQIDAAIILCPKVEDKVIKIAQNLAIPTILLDRLNPGGEFVYSNVLNSYDGASIATEYLVNQGRKKIAYLSGILGSHENEQRYLGYTTVLAEHNLPQMVYFGDFTEKSGRDIVEKLEGVPPFDGIFCANDEMAIGMINAFQKYRIKIPQDLNIIGFDDVDVSKYINGGLTTIGIEHEAWGITVAKDMLSILKGEVVETQKVAGIKIIKRNT